LVRNPHVFNRGSESRHSLFARNTRPPTGTGRCHRNDFGRVRDGTMLWTRPGRSRRRRLRKALRNLSSHPVPCRSESRPGHLRRRQRRPTGRAHPPTGGKNSPEALGACPITCAFHLAARPYDSHQARSKRRKGQANHPIGTPARARRTWLQDAWPGAS
jgi:hypothetical protein